MQKMLIALLMIAALAFSTAPSWVDKGVNLTYSIGSDHINYYVQSRNSTDIFGVTTNETNTKANNFDEDATQATDNEFWFDSTLLQSAYTGGTVDTSYNVASTGSQQFQGQTLTTVTLTQDYGGGVTGTFVYDQQTGLMLSATITGAQVPAVTLISATIPSIPAYSPPAPPPTPAPQPTPNPTPPAQNNSGGNQSPQQPPQGGQQNSSAPPTPTTPSTPSAPSGSNQNYSGVQVYNTKSPTCCSSAFILGVLGVAVFWSQRKK